MIKVYSLLLICMLPCVAVQAQNTSPKRHRPQHAKEVQPLPAVPDNLKAKFGIAYPEATVNGWQTEGNYYKVLFMDKNVQQVVVYDTSGNVVRKETELDAVDVPPGISEYYKSNYPDKKAYKVWRAEDSEGRQSYNSLVQDDVIYFDAEGKYQRAEKRKPLKIKQAPPKRTKR